MIVTLYFLDVNTNSPDKLNINEITISEIKDTIHSLDINKASGPDNISHRMLKGCISTIFKPLCLSFNRSLKEGVFPETWKKAVIYIYIKR